MLEAAKTLQEALDQLRRTQPESNPASDAVPLEPAAIEPTVSDPVNRGAYTAPADARMHLKLMAARVGEAWDAANATTRKEAMASLHNAPRATWPTLGDSVQDAVAMGWHGCLANALVALRPAGLDSTDAALLAGSLPPAPRHPEEALQGIWAAAEGKDPQPSFDGLVDAEELTRGALIQGPKQLRRAKDLLVASAGARMRFSRKHGLVILERSAGVRGEGALRIEDRSDCGSLAAFTAVEGERPRLFDPRFLKPVLHVRKNDADLLVVRGWLGRGPAEIPCRMVWTGREDAPLTLRVALHNDRPDHRIRMRFLGLPKSFVTHHCADVFETIHEQGRSFLAATLVRSCGTLQVGDDPTPTPGALGLGWIEHTFTFGG